jgi:GH25 family lysozyme M1 (1,4-beta-N-acetylmuramidase)
VIESAFEHLWLGGQLQLVKALMRDRQYRSWQFQEQQLRDVVKGRLDLPNLSQRDDATYPDA